MSKLQIENTRLPEVKLITPRVFADDRGYFFEQWKHSAYRDIGIAAEFVQSNVSSSKRGIVRGLHFQYPQPQGKLVQVLQGSVFDVAVDIRADSPTYTHWVGVELSAENHQQLWIPEGFAHGFQVLSDTAVFAYLCTQEYRAEYDRAIAWNDPDINIAWPLTVASLDEQLSEKTDWHLACINWIQSCCRVNS